MKYRLIIRPSAELDIASAFDWYEKQRLDLGSEFVEDVDEAMTRILQNPLQYQKQYLEIRRAIVDRFPYAVFFVETNEVISVLAVLHQSSDPGKWKGLGRTSRKMST